MANLKKILYIVLDVKQNLIEICDIFLSAISAMIKALFSYIARNFVDIIMILFCLLSFILVIYEIVANIMIMSNFFSLYLYFWMCGSYILEYKTKSRPKNTIPDELCFVILCSLLWYIFRVCLFVLMRHDVLWNQNLCYVCIHAFISIMIIFLWVYIQYYVRCWSCKKYAVSIQTGDKCKQCGVCQKCCYICDDLENGKKCDDPNKRFYMITIMKNVIFVGFHILLCAYLYTIILAVNIVFLLFGNCVMFFAIQERKKWVKLASLFSILSMVIIIVIEICLDVQFGEFSIPYLIKIIEIVCIHLYQLFIIYNNTIEHFRQYSSEIDTKLSMV
jgi:hypothetical protein